MYKQERVIDAVNETVRKSLNLCKAYEKYCGSLSLEDIFTSDHVSICACRCASGFMCKKDTRQFMKACEYNSFLLANKVCAGRYRPRYYPVTEIMERGKKRIIRPPVFECKVVQKVLCDFMLRPLLTPKMISTNYASISGRGTDKMYEDIEHTLNHLIRKGKKATVLVITDFKGYFASIPHEKLRNILERYIKDTKVTNLFMSFCECDEGLSLGNETSQIPASFYPSPVDHWVKDQNRLPYFRYMDDTLAAIPSDRKEWYIDGFRERSEDLGLMMKQPVTVKLGQEFVFCKERFYMGKKTGLYYRMINGKRVKNERRKLYAMSQKNIDRDDMKNQFKSVYGGIRQHPHSYKLCRKLLTEWEEVTGEAIW